MCYTDGQIAGKWKSPFSIWIDHMLRKLMGNQCRKILAMGNTSYFLV